MNRYEQVLHAIYDAVDQINDVHREVTLEKSPDTIVLGESSKLDSIGLVNFTVSVEENIERTFHRTIRCLDLVNPVGPTQWTLAALAKSISESLDSGAMT